MPIVFVHGVNNRMGSEYRDNEVARNAYIRAIVGPALGLQPADVKIFNPYWGDEGARPYRDGASMPEEKGETFGGDEDAEVLAAAQTAEVVSANPLKAEGVAESARVDFAHTVELVFAAAMAGATTDEEADALAELYLRAAAYARDNPAPAWLDQASDGNFSDMLLSELEEEEDEEEEFGPGDWLDQLKEGVNRLLNAPADIATDTLLGATRKKINSTASLFIGDVFTYLENRGDGANPGKIVQIVLKALRDAAAAKTASDNKLIVIAHSFGGEIVYDITTHFDPAIEIDVLITVGSQVGLFEELSLFKVSATPPPVAKVQRPNGIKRWINVYDTNDPFSYVVMPVFEGTSDFHYDTGFSALQAHGGYFLQPSFYQRLAARLTQP